MTGKSNDCGGRSEGQGGMEKISVFSYKIPAAEQTLGTLSTDSSEGIQRDEVRIR